MLALYEHLSRQAKRRSRVLTSFRYDNLKFKFLLGLKPDPFLFWRGAEAPLFHDGFGGFVGVERRAGMLALHGQWQRKSQNQRQRRRTGVSALPVGLSRPGKEQEQIPHFVSE